MRFPRFHSMDSRENNGQVRRTLHPVVWRMVLAAAALWVGIAWMLFARGGYSSVTLAMVTFFTIVVVAVALGLYQTWRHHPESHPAEAPRESLRRWLASDFEIWGGRIRTRDALAGILIPFGAVVLGAILIGIAFDLS